MKRFLRASATVCSLFLVFSLSACGTGEAEEVQDCTQCRPGEFCVAAASSLYCADSCLRHIDCALGFWCVPLRDEEDLSALRWVCMDGAVYNSGIGRVFSWGDYNCLDECDAGMECLVDDTGTTDQYFCSDDCVLDADCLTGCCVDTGSDFYCAPYHPYCS